MSIKRKHALQMATIATIVSLMAALGGCQSTPVTTFDYIEETDFTRIQSFSWIPERPLRFHTMDAHSSPLLEQHLKNAVPVAVAGMPGCSAKCFCAFRRYVPMGVQLTGTKG